MLLSQAILLGSIDTPQGFGPSSVNRNSASRCALGAALHAVGYEGKEPYTQVWDTWPWTKRPSPRCPECGDGHMYVGEDVGQQVANMIWILNDVHHWPRPRIAEWVASIEPAEEGVEAECQASLSSKN